MNRRSFFSTLAGLVAAVVGRRAIPARAPYSRFVVPMAFYAPVRRTTIVGSPLVVEDLMPTLMRVTYSDDHIRLWRSMEEHYSSFEIIA